MTTYVRLTDDDHESMYLDYDTIDEVVTVWDNKEGSGEAIGPYGEWPARELYEALKEIFE